MKCQDAYKSIHTNPYDKIFIDECTDHKDLLIFDTCHKLCGKEQLDNHEREKKSPHQCQHSPHYLTIHFYLRKVMLDQECS